MCDDGDGLTPTMFLLMLMMFLVVGLLTGLASCDVGQQIGYKRGYLDATHQVPNQLKTKECTEP